MFKKLLAVPAVVLFASSCIFAQVQIPNGGFETWTQGNPASWGTSDKVVTTLGQPDPGGAEQDTAAANVFAGTSAIRLTTKSITVPILGTQVVPGVVSLGTLGLSFSPPGPTYSGLAYTDRPDSVTFAAKFTKAVGSTDTGGVIVTLTSAASGQIQIVGNAFVQVANMANYQVFTVKINYQTNALPDTLLIQGLSGLSQNGAPGSTLWLDEMKFIGLDTAYKAYIAPLFDRSLCDGDTINFSTDANPGDTYQWYKNGVAVNNAISAEYEALVAGKYSVQVVHGGTTYHSDTVTLVYNPIPNVTLSLNTDTVCNNGATIELAGGTPIGGTYTGTGVSNGEFTPSGSGNKQITYAYTDNNGCAAEATDNIFVRVCTGIEELQDGWYVNIYPNPASNFIMLETDTRLNDGRIEIYSVDGQLVLAAGISTTKQTLDIHNLATGNYAVKLFSTANQTVANGKINIQR